MKWMRKILSCEYMKDDPQFHESKNPRVYTNCGWGELTEMDSKGHGYIKFESGGGQIVRNWNHFLDMVQQIETE